MVDGGVFVLVAVVATEMGILVVEWTALCRVRATTIDQSLLLSVSRYRLDSFKVYKFKHINKTNIRTTIFAIENK